MRLLIHCETFFQIVFCEVAILSPHEHYSIADRTHNSRTSHHQSCTWTSSTYFYAQAEYPWEARSWRWSWMFDLTPHLMCDSPRNLKSLPVFALPTICHQAACQRPLQSIRWDYALSSAVAFFWMLSELLQPHIFFFAEADWILPRHPEMHQNVTPWRPSPR